MNSISLVKVEVLHILHFFIYTMDEAIDIQLHAIQNKCRSRFSKEHDFKKVTELVSSQMDIYLI